MIKRPSLVQKFENEFIARSGTLPYEKALKLYESMWQEAVTFGIFPPKNPLEGIEVDIRIARALNSLNSCLKNS